MEGGPFEELEDDVGPVWLVDGLDVRDDVGVPDELEHVGLSKEPQPVVRAVFVLFVKVLDGDAPARGALHGFVDDTDPSLTDQGTERERFDARGGRHHGVNDARGQALTQPVGHS